MNIKSWLQRLLCLDILEENKRLKDYNLKKREVEILESIKRVTLGPDDLLVFKAESHLSDESYKELTKAIKGVIKGKKNPQPLLMEGGIDLSIIEVRKKR